MRTAVVTMAKMNSQRIFQKINRKIGNLRIIDNNLNFVNNLEFVDYRFAFFRDEYLCKKIKNFSNVDLVYRSINSTTANSFYGIWFEFAKIAVEKDIDLLIWINACCPFLRQETIYNAITQHEKEKITVPVVKRELMGWKESGEPLCERKLETQNSIKAQFLSHAFWIRSPKQILDTKNQNEYVLQHLNPIKFLIGKIESLDIDEEEDLLIAQSLWEKLY